MQLKRTTSYTLKGSTFARKTRSPFKPGFENNVNICVAVAVAFLVAKGPCFSNRKNYFYSSFVCWDGKGSSQQIPNRLFVEIR